MATCLLLFVITRLAWPAAKAHVITFGRWTTVKVLVGVDEDKPLELKVRPMFVDGRVKEYTLGNPHEISDRLFVVWRAVRVNDTLPGEAVTIPRWTWQREGWLVVDRAAGHISAANLPGFAPDTSAVAWYRDYVAYCGISDDGRKLLAMVMQLGRRRPILKKAIRDVADPGDLQCATPSWQRQPARVTFSLESGQTFTYAVRGHMVEVTTDDQESDPDP